jgi:RNA polymerase primary sigma factor
MTTDYQSLRAYCSEISDHELLGRDGEVALAKQIEDREVKTWETILAFTPAAPVVFETLENAGLSLDSLDELQRAYAADVRPEAQRLPHSEDITNTARQIRELDRDRIYLDEVRAAIDQLSLQGREQEQWLRAIVNIERSAEASRQRFIRANLRFVVTMSKKFAGRGIPTEDLIQEGNLGLIKAVNRFDYHRGYRFSTYAGWWIRHAMRRSVANIAHPVRRPVHVQEARHQILRAQRELARELGRDATYAEIAKACGLPVPKVRSVLLSFGAIVSLDEPVGENGATLLELLTDPANDETSLLDMVLQKEEAAELHALVGKLPSMQADILRKRFGLDTDAPMTLRSIGQHYGLSRERIRQIQSAALQTLRVALRRRERLQSTIAAS